MKKSLWSFSSMALVAILILGFTSGAHGAKVEDYISNPPFSTASVPPNVIVMLDNSGSMKNIMYGSSFDPSEEYYGIFNSNYNYSYDTSIPVDNRQYDGTGDAVYDVALDTTRTGAFLVNTTCAITPANNCWDGNFLNWLTTRRIDSARMVLVGGKVENRDGVDLNSDTIADYWKIVGNNEPEDRDYTKSDSDSATHSPFPSASFTLTSPAKNGNVGSPYDPYAKLLVELESVALMEEQGGVPTKIGEIGQTVAFDEDWSTVTFSAPYTTPPIVVAGPMSYEGGDPSALRIRNVTTTGFEIMCIEYELKNRGSHNQGHANEKAYYIAIEPGEHQIIDGPLIYAGSVSSVDENWTTESYTGSPFASTPVIISAPVTASAPVPPSPNGYPTPLVVRMRNVGVSDFELRLQAEEADEADTGNETVDYLAIEQGEFISTTFGTINVDVENVLKEKDRNDFSNDLSGGLLLASIQSYNDDETAGLRLKDNSILIEEDTSDDNEQDRDSSEGVGYVHVDMTTTESFNVAVLVDVEPEGLMHDVYDTVRLGVSFYNYQYRDSNIYNGETNDGGTLRLKIPLNPFIDRPYVDNNGKNPSQSGFNATQAEAKFRTVDTYVRGKINDTSVPTEAEEGLTKIVDAIEHYPLVWGTTPIAENLVEVGNYFRQNGDPEYDDQIDYEPYLVNDTWDPYVIENGSPPVDCLDSFVLIFTDGEPYKDGCVPSMYEDDDLDSNSADGRLCDQDGDNERNAEDNLDDVAHFLNTNDLRDSSASSASAIDGTQNIKIYTVGFAGGSIRQILYDTAANAEGKAYAAADGKTLAPHLADIFDQIQNQASSGTAAGVVSQSRSGVGAIYQALFFQELDETNWAGEIQTLLIDDWGNLREDTDLNHQLTNDTDMILVFQEDATIDLYADPDGNGLYSYDCDSSIAYLSCASSDNDCNGYDDGEEIACAGDAACLSALTECRDTSIAAACMKCDQDRDDISFLWKASDWLNNLADVQSQRLTSEFTEESASLGTDPDTRRYLFTFADTDGDMIADAGEQIDFTCSGCTTDGAVLASLEDTASVFPYLTLYSSLDGNGDTTNPWSFDDQLNNMMSEEINGDSTVFSEYLRYNAMRLINFIRGEDQDEDSSGNVVIKTFYGDDNYNAPLFRKRKVDGSEWRLGDAVYSTPTMIASPKEAFHLLYRDDTYATFAGRYQHRRGVVYIGTNDGIFHAFNAGFFKESYTDTTTTPNTVHYDKFWENCEYNGKNQPICEDDSKYIDLGAELWGYIPHNLLPHLYWLTEEGYSSTHVYYNDLKPRVFDAKIFEEEAICSSSSEGRLDEGCIHPYGWGTVLVGGMRLGGGEIRVDMDKSDTSSIYTYDPSTDRTMSSAYFILDITNPEAPPTVLAEITFPGLGFTTCYPTAVPIRDESSVTDSFPNTDNRWFLLFGNGPDDIDDAASTNTGKIYLVDLNDLGKGPGTRQLTTLSLDPGTGLTSLREYNPNTSTHNPYAQELEANTFVSDPIAVDYNLDFKADAAYFGTVSGSVNNWSGKFRRVVIDNDYDPTNWNFDSVMLDLTDVDIDGDSYADNGQPITAGASVALDTADNRWLYFGTGRYFVEDDESNLDQQSYYGVKEPQDTTGNFTWAEVTRSDLEDVTNIWVSGIDNITDESGIDISGISDTTNNDWDELTTLIRNNPNGWRLDFPDSGERNIGQAALLGEILTFTTYVPPDLVTDPCLVDGESYLWALYYETGTSYYKEVFENQDFEGPIGSIDRRISVGKGLAISPNLHVGRGEGSKAILQTSTGAIKIEQQKAPGMTKSGKTGWLERR